MKVTFTIQLNVVNESRKLFKHEIRQRETFKYRLTFTRDDGYENGLERSNEGIVISREKELVW